MDGITVKKVDARRLLCPLPVIRAQDSIAKLQTNDQLIITCTDPGAKHDIPSWCRINGHAIEKMIEIDSQSGREIVITIRIGEK